MRQIEIDPWDNVAALLHSVWSSVAYVTATARHRKGDFEERTQIIRLGPRETEPPCPKIAARYRREHQFNVDEDVELGVAEMPDADLLDLTTELLRDELEAWADGLQTPAKVIVQVYGHKGSSLGSRTVTITDKSALKPVAVASEATDPVPASASLGFDATDLAYIEDPTVRQLVMALMLQRQHNDKLAEGYERLLGNMSQGYQHLQAMTSAAIGDVERVNRRRFLHVERMQQGELARLEQDLAARRQQLNGTTVDDLGNPVQRAPVVAPEVQGKAIDAVTGIGDKLLGAFMAHKGMDPELAPLLSFVNDHPDIKPQLAKLAQVAKDPDQLAILKEILSEAASIADATEPTETAA